MCWMALHDVIAEFYADLNCLRIVVLGAELGALKALAETSRISELCSRNSVLNQISNIGLEAKIRRHVKPLKHIVVSKSYSEDTLQFSSDRSCQSRVVILQKRLFISLGLTIHS